MEVNFDYLIVGQGIAGTLLTHFLLKKGKKVLVTDKYNPSSASNVAAGICNPITGRRFVKTWKADLLLPFAELTYHELEKELGSKFWYGVNILKLLSHTEEKELITTKSLDPDFSNYIIPHSTSDSIDFLEISHSGYVDMKKLLGIYREKLKQENRIIESHFKREDLSFNSDNIYWKDMPFNKVIFCEGYKAVNNPLFSWLPFMLAKGEVLTIYSRDLNQSKILIKDIFILPIGNDLYKVGSTYNWHNPDETPTPEGKEELIRKLNQMADYSYTITEHQAGVRPTVKDRRPFLGLHPIHKNIGIFNGLGTKGASLAPYFAQHFVEFLEEGKALDKEVDIRRYAGLMH